ncbi:hypothetical protein Tco_0901251, partial [Tanacetum coccineum]
GGLGISSFYALNRALLFKWVWRFHTQSSSLWAKVIKGIHGIDGKIGNGLDTYFWDDVWKGYTALKHLYPRIYALESMKLISVASKLGQFSENIMLADSRDRWLWSLEGSGEFSIASVRRVIDDKLLPLVSSKTRWGNVVPIKVNIHAWKVKLDYLLTRLNISRRGIDVSRRLVGLIG